MPDRKELFDVVMIKSGVSEFAAKPDDFSRVQVEAHDSVSARWDPKVAAAEAAGARIHAVLPPGHASEAEAQARQRTYNGGVQDRAKIGFWVVEDLRKIRLRLVLDRLRAIASDPKDPQRATAADLLKDLAAGAQVSGGS